MKKIFFILILSSGFATCYAQKFSKDSNFVQKKNDLVIETGSNLTQLNAPTGIMYRRNFKKISLRIRLTGNYKDSYSTNTLRTKEQYSFTSAVGLQKNVQFTKIFSFYWGSDLTYSQNFSSLKDSVINNRRTITAAGLAPFVGIKLTLRRFIMGAENSGEVDYAHSETINDRNDGTYSTHIESKINSFDFYYSRMVRFYFGFNF